MELREGEHGGHRVCISSRLGALQFNCALEMEPPAQAMEAAAASEGHRNPSQAMHSNPSSAPAGARQAGGSRLLGCCTQNQQLLHPPLHRRLALQGGEATRGRCNAAKLRIGRLGMHAERRCTRGAERR